VLGEAQPPDEPQGEEGGPGSAITAPRGGAPRPEVLAALMTPQELSGDGEVILTNVALAGVTLVMILITATLFNQTVQENSEEIEAWLGRLLTPVRGLGEMLGGVWEAASGNGSGLAAAAGPLSVLGLTGLVYGFAEPGFGFNEKSLVMFLSLVLGVGVATYVYSGGQVLLTSRGFGVPAGVRLFPVAIAVAVISVVLSRVENFQPGIIYGFIASYAVLTPIALRRHQVGQTVLIPGSALLAVCLAAWLALDPLRELAQENDSWLAAVPEGAAVAIFVGGLEGLFFNMVPLHFMDGHKLWTWNKGAWALMAGVTAFMFWHILLNEERAYYSALQETTAAGAVVLLGICLGLTLSVWLFFRVRAGRGVLPA
jgi:hypothetical protein